MSWFGKKSSPRSPNRSDRASVPAPALASPAARRLLVPAELGHDARPLRVLMVCTANVSRSPLAAALLSRAAESRGIPMDVTSAGTRTTGHIVDEAAQAAGAELGVHYPDHRPRVLSGELLATHGADLIIGMAREHAREVVLIDPAAFGRTFTLKELVRRADALGELPSEFVTLDSWLDALTHGRDHRDLLGQNVRDDVSDPFGRSSGLHREIALELESVVSRLSTHLQAIVVRTA